MKEIQELYGYLIMYKHLTDSDVTKALDLLKNIENNTIEKAILKDSLLPKLQEAFNKRTEVQTKVALNRIIKELEKQ